MSKWCPGRPTNCSETDVAAGAAGELEACADHRINIGDFEETNVALGENMAGAYKYRPQYTQNTIGASTGDTPEQIEKLYREALERLYEVVTGDEWYIYLPEEIVVAARQVTEMLRKRKEQR